MKNKEQRLIALSQFLSDNPMCRRVMDILKDDGRTDYEGLSKRIFGGDPSEEEEALLDRAIKMLRRKKLIGKIRRKIEDEYQGKKRHA